MFLAQLSSWVWAWPLWPVPGVPVVISQETCPQSAGDQVTRVQGEQHEEPEMVMAGTCSI